MKLAPLGSYVGCQLALTNRMFILFGEQDAALSKEGALVWLAYAVLAATTDASAVLYWESLCRSLSVPKHNLPQSLPVSHCAGGMLAGNIDFGPCLSSCQAEVLGPGS